MTVPLSGGRELADELPPRWLALPLAAGLAMLVVASAVGVVALVLGVFTPAVVAAGTIALGVPAAILAVRALPGWSSAASVHAAAAAAVTIAAALTIWNGAHHGQHLVADRDPGVYVTTARHLMDEGDVLVPGPTGPFVGAHGVSSNGAGFSSVRGDGTLEPQFPHLTSASLAVGGWVAETGLFLVTPLLAGLGLLCLYAFASTMVGPRWATVALVVTGVTMPFTVFARDAYSEPITTVLVFGGLWFLHLAHRRGRWPLWLVAGLAVGAASMARVDSYLYLAPVTVALVLAVRTAPADHRRSALMGAGWCGLGLLTTSAIGWWDTFTLTGGYYEAALGPRLPAMVGAAVAGGGIAWLVAPRLWSPDAGATRLLRGGVAVAIMSSVAFLAWAWWVRPDPEGLPVIATEGVNILSYLPQAATLSLRWLGWYFAPIPLVIALGGLLWAVLGLARVPRPDAASVAALGAVLVTLGLYLWSPNITPDHPWAMRRFAAVALPGLAIGIAVACRAIWSAGSIGAVRPLSGVRSAVVGTIALAVAGASIVTVAAVTWPTRDARAQVPMRDRMHEICDILQPDDAVLVTIDGILALMMSVPVGVWCDVPSGGGTAKLEPIDVARMAIAWEADGRRLVVLSSSETPVFNTLRPAGIVTRAIELEPMFPEAVEPTLTSRPDEVVADGRFGKGPDGEITFYLYVIDTDRARRLIRVQDEPSAFGAGAGAGE
ncbi:MAG: glycosyltransferase family 39 protein [Acidimicrobiales bacterium]